MKKTFLMVCTALVALIACEKQPVEYSSDVGNAQIVFNLSATHPDNLSTKAVKTSWETNDVIFVFIAGQTAPNYLEMKWNGTEWVKTPKGTLSLSDGNVKMRAIYLPFGSQATVSADGSGNYVFDQVYYSYYLTDEKTYPVSGGVVTGVFNMQIPSGYMQFFLDNTSASASDVIELRESHLTPVGVGSISADASLTLTESKLAHGAPMPGYVYDKEAKLSGEKKGYLFSGILAEGARGTATSYIFTLVSGGWTGSYYSLSGNRTFYTDLTADRAIKFPSLSSWATITTHKPIDMGTDVPTGVGTETKRIYWSDRNLGAANPQGFGNYYSWGATATQTNYNWANYPFMQAGQSDWKHITKYTYADGQTEGIWYDGSTFKGDNGDGVEHRDFASYGYVDDAARQQLHGTWRIPTTQEWEALLNTANYTWAWTSNYNGTGVSGRTVTRNTGPNPKPSIFLPAAGDYLDTSRGGIGNYGGYYSSTLGEGLLDYAKFLYLGSVDYLDTQFIGSNGRYYGRSLRAVSE
jgi:hypothetical protein